MYSFLVAMFALFNHKISIKGYGSLSFGILSGYVILREHACFEILKQNYRKSIILNCSAV